MFCRQVIFVLSEYYHLEGHHVVVPVSIMVHMQGTTGEVLKAIIVIIHYSTDTAHSCVKWTYVAHTLGFKARLRFFLGVPP